MKLLVDTHILLWFASGDELMPLSIRREIESDGNELFVSMASYWEIAIKQSLGKLELKDSLNHFIFRRVDEGFQTLPVEYDHLAKVGSLPFHHRDPFDRMIISQAICEGMAVCTNDEHFSGYTITVIR